MKPYYIYLEIIKKIYIKCDKISEKSAECTAEIRESKKNYILNMTSKLVDSHTAPKTYWTLLNRFLYNKKIPSIPLLLVDGKIVSDFYEKSNIFNNLFCITMYSNKKCKDLAILFVQDKHQNKVPLTLQKDIYYQ